MVAYGSCCYAAGQPGLPRRAAAAAAAAGRGQPGVQPGGGRGRTCMGLPPIAVGGWLVAAWCWAWRGGRPGCVGCLSAGPDRGWALAGKGQTGKPPAMPPLDSFDHKLLRGENTRLGLALPATRRRCLAAHPDRSPSTGAGAVRGWAATPAAGWAGLLGAWQVIPRPGTGPCCCCLVGPLGLTPWIPGGIRGGAAHLQGACPALVGAGRWRPVGCT